MDTLTLKAEVRAIRGKAVRALRGKGLLPAVLYGHGVPNVNLVVPRDEFLRVFKMAGTSTLINLSVDGKAQKALIHDVAYHPLTDEPLHVDFYQVKLTEKIKTEIPLKFVGEAPAVRELGGSLTVQKETVNVEALPTDLVGEIEIDISSLATFDDVITVANLKVPANIAVLNDPEEVVAVVAPPISEEELAALEAPVEEKVEAVEVEAEKRQEPAPSEEGARTASEEERGGEER